MQKQEINKALSLHVQDSLHQRNIMIQRRRNEKLDAEIAAVEESIKAEMGLNKKYDGIDSKTRPEHESIFELSVGSKKKADKPTEKATAKKANV